MVAALFDTCILVDNLQGVPDAVEAVAAMEDRAISVVTWMEVMAGCAPLYRKQTEAYLATFAIVEISQQIAARALKLGPAHGLGMADALVLATARETGRLLVTCDGAGVPADDPGICFITYG